MMMIRRALAGIDYTSPVCKINVALDKIPNFLADPNTSSDGVMPHHQATIHLNCEDSDMIERAYNDAKSGIYSRQVTTVLRTNNMILTSTFAVSSLNITEPISLLQTPPDRDGAADLQGPHTGSSWSPRLSALHPVRSVPPP